MASRQFSSETPKWSSISSERKKPGVKASAATLRWRRRWSYTSIRSQRWPDHRGLYEIVEEASAVAGPHAVGYLQDQASLTTHHERGGVVARDDVRLDSLPQHGKPVLERELPERCVELRQGFPTPDVVY